MVEIKNVEVFIPNKKKEDFEYYNDYLKSITVVYDMKGNGVFLPEFQRYMKYANCGISMSQSTMHSMEKFMSNENHNPFTKYVTKETIEQCRKNYNNWKQAKEKFSENSSTENKIEVYKTFEILVHNLPRGFELWASVTTNFLQLKTICIQRGGHRNIEDWGSFIEFCYDIPKFRELCGFSGEEWNLDRLFPLKQFL